MCGYESYEYVFKTLAAVVDTFVPGILNQEIQIKKIDFNTGQITQLGSMNNLGATGTDTPGAAIFPECYGLLNVYLPVFSGEKSIVPQLITILDQFAGQSGMAFKDLPYEARYSIMDNMDKPFKLISLGLDPFEAFAIKRLFTATLTLANAIYYSEYCNVARDEEGNFLKDNKGDWELRPEGAWSQMGYPGPRVKYSSYASNYDGLKVKIANSKVKFVG